MSLLRSKSFRCTNIRCLSVQQPPLGSTPKKENEDTFDAFRVREEKKEEDFASSISDKTESHETTDSKETVDESIQIKTKILEAALTFVPAHGWTKTSLSHGAEQIGFPSIAHGMFSRGGVEIVEYFNGKCNTELIECMKQMSNENSYEIPTKFVAKAVETRLRMIEQYKDIWPQALALMAMPPNVPVTLSNLLTMVDDICYYAGDRSVDVRILDFYEHINSTESCSLLYKSNLFF